MVVRQNGGQTKWWSDKMAVRQNGVRQNGGQTKWRLDHR